MFWALPDDNTQMIKNQNPLSWKFRFLTLLITFIYKTLHLTFKFVEHDLEQEQKAKELHPEGKYIIALWHKNIFSSIQSRVPYPHITMASRSKDGEVIAQVLERFNYLPARGSSSRGGKEAMQEMISLLNNPSIKLSAALTVDGPRGPALEVKGGIIQIAKQTGTSILPFAGLPKRGWKLKSWDRFIIPCPFTTIHLFKGRPILVPPDLNPEQFENFQTAVKLELMELEKRAALLQLFT